MDRTERGAKFWLRVMNELKGRGVEDVLIAIVDGLKGSSVKNPPEGGFRRFGRLGGGGLVGVRKAR